MELRKPLPLSGAMLGLLATLAAPVAFAGLGRTPGSAWVSDDGEASYSVPVDIPPGTNGLTPAVSIDYRHRTRGGLLGVGWSVGGLSQVTRCARTFAQDGVAEPAGKFTDDRFCLDGQRLKVVNGAEYGAVNAEYRTEVESFARVRSVGGSMALGPAYFIVERADGRNFLYGSTADSSIEGQSTPPAGGARTWAVNRIRDRTGNVIDYRYTEESGSTAFRIASIRYNSNPSNGVEASHEVTFKYEQRPSAEIDSGYVAGLPVREVVRLVRIEIRYSGEVIRSYNLDYEGALSSGGRSRLSRLTECAGSDSDCLAPTTFEWQDGSDGMSAVAAFAAQLPSSMTSVAGAVWNVADVNGDGRHDYVFAAGADRASATLRYRLSLADGGFGPTVNTGTPCPGGVGRPFDANGDGRTDFLVGTSSGRWSIAYGTAAGLAAAIDTGITTPAGLRDSRGADMNGDGLGDIVWSEVPDPVGNSLRVRVRFAKSTGGFAEPVTLYSQWDALGNQEATGGYFIGEPGRRIDLDGDGSEEVLMNEEYTVARISDRDHATDRPDVVFRGGVPLDFNDDGCTDMAYKHMTSGTLRVRLSACSINAPVRDLQGGTWTGDYMPLTLDWNGDGRDDVLLRGDTTWQVALSLGDAIAPIEDTGIPHEDALAIAGRDLDGDGLEDIAHRTSSQIRARFRAGPIPDLLTSATDGFGVIARFIYRPLTNASVYTAGSPAGWPEPSLQTNDVVVNELRTTDGTGNGGIQRTAMSYEGLRANVQGRGSLGFRKVTRSERGDGEALVSVLTRRQDFPFTGLPESIVLQQLSGPAISSTEYRWSKLDYGTPGNSRRFPYASSTTTRRFGYGGTFDGIEVSRTVRSVAAIDAASGVFTDETTTTTEMAGGGNAGSSASLRTVHNSILNDVENWCLGRAQAVTITASHTLAGGAPISRTAGQSWSGPKCRPTRVELFPGDSQLQVSYDLSYDSFGNLASEKLTGTGMPIRTVTTLWGARGQLPSRVTNPLGQASNYSWDEGRGLPTSFTDPNGLSVRWTYDSFGRPVRESLPDGTRTEWTRETCKSGCDARTKYRIRQDEVDANGVVRAKAWLEMDQMDRGIRQETLQSSGGRAVVAAEFDARGRIVRHVLPHWDGGEPPGHAAVTHDPLGRLTAEQLVAAGGSVERSNEVRHDGLVVTQTDHLGRIQAITRSAWGNVVEAVDAGGGRTQFEHDAFGQLVGVRDALGNDLASITYDARGGKIAADDMDRGTWRWTLNALGEITAVRDAKGQVSRFDRDALGRVTQRTNADGTATWTWGTVPSKRNVGRLAGVTTTGYSEAHAYDAAGRPASSTITSDATYRFDFTYNSLGLLDQLSYPAAGAAGRFRIRHDYDSGRITKIRNGDASGDTYWSLNAKDASGNALDETLGTGVRVVSGFSPLTGDLEYRQAGKGGGGGIQDLVYGWDAAGNLAWRKDLNQALLEEFRYDSLDRLLQARRNGEATLDIDYDLIGNIRRKSDVCSGTSACYGYHATQRHAVVSAGGRSYAYDANGNMTARNGGVIAWTADGLPKAIAGDAGSESSFAYAPDGSRWRQVARQGGTTETTVYAGGLFEKVTRGGVTSWRHYVPAPGGTLMQLQASDGSPPAIRILALDHLGSTDRIVDGAGNAVVGTSFAAFGTRRRPTWTGLPTSTDLAKLAAVTRDGFTGHEVLDNLGLIHMNGRVYDPVVGRFLSADPYVTQPFHGQALNRYSYVLNSPLAFTDPTGFDPVPCLATQSGDCVQITVIAAIWADYIRSSGGAHAGQVASSLERDPCGQFGSGTACSMPGIAQTLPSTIVLTVGRQPDSILSTGGRLDAIQGFAARVANLAISSSPIALLFGADPDFQYFREPDSASGRAGSMAGNLGYFAGGAIGAVRAGTSTAGASAIARSFQGRGRYPGIDRFRDITLKKGTLLYAGYPGQSAFYTTASAMRRAGSSASVLFQGLQVAPHATKGPRVRAAAYEVIEDAPAAFALAIANPGHGSGWLPQVVVPSYMTTLRYLNDFPLGH
ncbi:MAG TPA: RHS repeat-associated core domain-containing protein [Steroidobacteraceae bacterium]|nr:RHS repeat-associated core domain-containing protein [Steroidobacteraceae bacterium]